jgi:hypothetical protein
MTLMKPASNCCGADVRVCGHTTRWYECLACNSPCDPVGPRCVPLKEVIPQPLPSANSVPEQSMIEHCTP